MQPRPLTDYIIIVVVILIAAFFAHQFFPKIETTVETNTVYKHDTTTVVLQEVKYVHLPGRVDTIFVPGQVPQVVMKADTLFPDSAHLQVAAYLPPLSYFDFDYQPAPQKVVTLEKIVTKTVIKTETTIDLDWVLGGVAVGVVGGILISHQIK